MPYDVTIIDCSSPALSADGTVYVTSFDHAIYAIDSGSGVLKWTYATGGRIKSS